MKTLVAAFLIFAAALPARADIPVKITCRAASPSPVAPMMAALSLQSHTLLLANGYAFGRLEALTQLLDSGEPSSFDLDLRETLPEVSYEVGQATSRVSFNFAKVKGEVLNVNLWLKTNLLSHPKLDRRRSVVTVEMKDGSVQRGLAYCSVERG